MPRGHTIDISGGRRDQLEGGQRRLRSTADVDQRKWRRIRRKRRGIAAEADGRSQLANFSWSVRA